MSAPAKRLSPSAPHQRSHQARQEGLLWIANVKLGLPLKMIQSNLSALAATNSAAGRCSVPKDCTAYEHASHETIHHVTTYF